MSLQCAQYVISDGEDEGLYLLGSEEGADKIALSERDIVYLSKGSNAGVKAGDLYSLHHAAYTVRHPVSGKKIGTKVVTTGWLKVVLVQEDTACAVIEHSCLDIHAERLKPFESTSPCGEGAPAECCAANSNITRHIVDLPGGRDDRGHRPAPDDRRGHRRQGPGGIFSVYRIICPSIPLRGRRQAVVAVRDRTATAGDLR
jgi:hypothetical protein